MVTPIGGSELQYALLAKTLATGGYEVVIIYPHIAKDFIILRWFSGR